MKTSKGKDYFQFYSNRYTRALQEENYDEALDAIMKGYFIARDMGDEKSRQAFLDSLKMAISDLIEESLVKLTEEAEQGLCCSFCGRKADEVKLMAGARGSICQTCAVQVHEYFTQEQ